MNQLTSRHISYRVPCGTPKDKPTLVQNTDDTINVPWANISIYVAQIGSSGEAVSDKNENSNHIAIIISTQITLATEEITMYFNLTQLNQPSYPLIKIIP